MPRSAVTEASRIVEPIEDEVWGSFNEEQLWFIYLGLIRLVLIPPLQEACRQMAQAIHAVGTDRYGWV